MTLNSQRYTCTASQVGGTNSVQHPARAQLHSLFECQFNCPLRQDSTQISEFSGADVPTLNSAVFVHRHFRAVVLSLCHYPFGC